MYRPGTARQAERLIRALNQMGLSAESAEAMTTADQRAFIARTAKIYFGIKLRRPSEKTWDLAVSVMKTLDEKYGAWQLES
jgi:hypothetical protein